MKREKLTESDLKLVNRAKDLIKLRQKPDWHAVSAVLRTRSGETYEGIHLEAYVGRIAVCAEAVALGGAATAGDTNVETIVAVNKVGEIVSPCGMCRELIGDYAPDAKVILKDENGEFKASIQELLPLKYRRD